MKKLEIKENDWSIGRGFGQIQHDKELDDLSGLVFTKNGLVEVYAQGDDVIGHTTYFIFVINGRCYYRNFNRKYSKRYIVTLAKRFSDEIIDITEKKNLNNAMEETK